jgi:hypothetical protein
VLDNLGRPDLLGAIQPPEIYRACWQVLTDCGDRRADDAGDAARSFVEASTALIDDDELRERFLQRIVPTVQLDR